MQLRRRGAATICRSVFPLREPQNPTYPGGTPNPIAQLGPCPELVVSAFGAINQAASTLLQNTYGKYAKVNYEDMSTYDKAVFLNTAAAAASVGVNLSNAKFDSFLYSDKHKTGDLPYGMYVSGIRGVTGGRHRNEGSVNIKGDGMLRSIDVDLYNPTGGGWDLIRRLELFDAHQSEIGFNRQHQRPTHPGDVVGQLQKGKKVNTGVSCKK